MDRRWQFVPLERHRSFTAWHGADRLLSVYYPSACHSNNDHVRGQEWHIPLLDIDRSAKILMRKDAGFKKRLASNALTMADVERLFMEVTYGIIELELFEGY